jgi:hypothetical protein
MEHQRPEQDTEHRQKVRDDRRSRRTAPGQQVEEEQVRHARPEEAQPQDREDRLWFDDPLPRPIDDEREHRRDGQCETDLEQRRDHRPEAVHVSPRIDRAERIGRRRTEECECARDVGARRGRGVETDHERDPDEPEDDPDDPPRPKRLVAQHQRRDRDDEDRDRAVQGGGDRRVDPLLCPGDQ